MTKPRVRFAPSPTGPLHIGGVRTALFNYLFAKKHGGTFYLRIEDTDQNRYVPGAESYILEALDWLGIAPTETVGRNEVFGPYRQSERKAIYREYADRLLETGHAYYAFDSAESLDKLRKEAESAGTAFIYNHQNRLSLDNSLHHGSEEAAHRIAAGEEYVVRFKTPENRKVVLRDLIRGEITFESGLLDDKVLFKSDGMPTYHLANIVDDHLMETTHVIRGEEWLPSLPLHVMLYEAFGWQAPEFAHLPLILKPVGNGKLSKRDGDKMGFPVFPLEWKDPATGEISSGYREKGYYPEAVVNFLALLGWNDGTTRELFSLDDLCDAFDLTRVHKAGAKFDPEKNKWFNHHYLQLQSEQSLIESFRLVLAEKNVVAEDAYIGKVVSLIKERANFVSEFWSLSHYFFVAPSEYDPKVAKNWKPDSGEKMKQLSTVLAGISDFTSASIEQEVKGWITANALPMGGIMQPLRISLVGALEGPHLFDILEMVGIEESLSRIDRAIAYFDQK